MHSVVNMLNKHTKFDKPLGQNNRLKNTDKMSVKRNDSQSGEELRNIYLACELITVQEVKKL
jgi:hypothetical protein